MTDIDTIIQAIRSDTQALGFDMGSDRELGLLLRTLAASKPVGKLLELGTGTGLATAWILAGMDKDSSLITVDNDAKNTAIATKHLGHDKRLTVHTQDGLDLLHELQGQHFDFIFADTWPGKIDHPELALNLVAKGGLYIIDDLELAWTDEAELQDASEDLLEIWQGQRNVIALLNQSSDFVSVELQWATGFMIATRLS